jgi:phosphoglycolate phosphatase
MRHYGNSFRRYFSLESEEELPTLVFGLDGTLIDTVAVVQLNLTAALSSIGRNTTFSRDQILSLLGDGEPILIQRALDLTGGAGASDPRALLRTYRDAALRPESLAAAAPLPGVAAALEELRGNGHRMAVCTSRSQAAAEALLASLQLRHFFDAVVGGDRLPVCKPVREKEGVGGWASGMGGLSSGMVR